MNQYISVSDYQTKQIAKNLAKKKDLQVIALIGDLGAGKTTFAAGFAEGLGIKEKIISPTFVLIRQHKIPQTSKMLFHIDLYRLEHDINLAELGLKDLWSDPNNIILIEWAERIKELPKGSVKIYFEKIEKDKRKIIIE